MPCAKGFHFGKDLTGVAPGADGAEMDAARFAEEVAAEQRRRDAAAGGKTASAMALAAGVRPGYLERRRLARERRRFEREVVRQQALRAAAARGRAALQRGVRGALSSGTMHQHKQKTLLARLFGKSSGGGTSTATQYRDGKRLVRSETELATQRELEGERVASEARQILAVRGAVDAEHTAAQALGERHRRREAEETEAAAEAARRAAQAIKDEAERAAAVEKDITKLRPVSTMLREMRETMRSAEGKEARTRELVLRASASFARVLE